MPDAFEQTVREIFPDDHPGSFVRLPDGRWVWATFHTFQWDLNYSNPDVFRAMAGEMLFLANQGVDILRMDAVAFIWKQLGTPCENLPEAHTLLQAFNAVCRLAAPSLLFKSEAIVHPDEVALYIDPAECQLSYNPLQMALIWEAMATRDVSLLAQALERRHNIPDGHVLGELRPQPRRHRLDICRRGRRRARHQRLRPPPLPQFLLRQPFPRAASPAACRSRTTRARVTAASPARRRRSAGWRTARAG